MKEYLIDLAVHFVVITAVLLFLMPDLFFTNPYDMAWGIAALSVSIWIAEIAVERVIG